MTTYLLLDTNYLAWRAFHSTGGLSYKGEATGVIYGILRDIKRFQELFQTDRVVFCFDHGKNKRIEIDPAYKAGRREKYENATDEEKEALKGMREQIHKLKTEYLTDLGFTNVFYQEGYEADDMIAMVVRSFIIQKEKREAIIISADKDLYQLLGPQVLMWNPNTQQAYTETCLIEEYGVEARQWARVKAMAGCPTDNVAGLVGVGEKTACKFILNQLKPSSMAYGMVIANQAKIKKNLRLVELPLLGTKERRPVRNEVTDEAWQRVTEKLGFKSLQDATLTPTGFGY